MSDASTLSKRAQFGIPLSYGFFILFGAFGGELLPTLNKNLQDTFTLTNTELGYIISAVALLGVVSNLLGGYLTDRVGALHTLLWTSLSLALCLLFLWIQRDPTLFFIGYFLFVLLLGLTVATNALGASLYGTQQAERMSTLHGCQGVGRILSPLILATLLERGFSWFTIFFIGALGHLFFFMLFIRLQKLESPPPILPITKKSFFLPNMNSNVWIGLIAFFFCAATEAIYMNWIPVFFESEASYSKADSLLCLSAMMIGYTIVRFAPLWFKMRATSKFLLLTVFIQVASTTILFLHPSLFVSIFMSGLLGFSFGIYWPAQLVVVYEFVPSAAHGTVVGLAVTTSAIGIFVLNTLFGYLIERSTIGTIFLVLPICSLLFVWLHEQSKKIQAD
ncbi:MAG: MFS transporter [Bdellovibrionales bacterium]|nr:MFS transporter [Bdellovibrionales bacterium]